MGIDIGDLSYGFATRHQHKLDAPMNVSLNLKLGDFFALSTRIFERYNRLFKSAFDVDLKDPFPEVAERLRELYPDSDDSYFHVVLGIVDRDVKACLDKAGTDAPEFLVNALKVRSEAMQLFLAKVKPSSVYNEDILERIAYCWVNQMSAEASLRKAQPLEAMDCLLRAGQELGKAEVLLELRERGRDRASKGGRQRHASTQEEKERAEALYRQFFAGKGLSNEQVAYKLREQYGIEYHLGGIARLISRTRKEMESEE